MGDRHFMQRRGPNTSLYVRPIDETMRPDEVKAHFAQFGHIRDVHIPIDFNTRKPRGFAYIEFQNLNEAQAACDGINKTEFHGKLLYVDFAAGDRKTPGQMKTQKEAIALKLKIDQLRELQDQTRKKAREAEMIREGIPLNREEERGYKDRRFIRDDRGGGRRDDRGGRDDRRGSGRYDDRGGRDHGGRSDHRGGDRRDSYGGGGDHRNRSRSPRRDHRRDDRHNSRSESRAGSSRGGDRYEDRRRDEGGRRDDGGRHHDDRRGSYKDDYKQERHEDRGDRRGHDDRRHGGHDNQGGYDDRRSGGHDGSRSHSRSHHEHDDRGGYKQERDDRR